MRLHRPPGPLDWFDGMPSINDGTLYPTLGMIPGPICNFGSIFTELVNVFDPTGKNFSVRLDSFIIDAERKYSVSISKTATQRKPEDAQKWHIAHMFFYNSFAQLKPKQKENEQGHAVLAWDYFSKASLTWEHGMDWREFLRDENGHVPIKTANGLDWQEGHQPDKDKSKKRAYQILATAGIATPDAGRPHGAMVAPGFEGCGEPCKCGAHPSKHTAGLACDIDMSGIHRLEMALRKQKAGSLDGYLKEFGLKRPMTKEPWHIEATA